VVKKIVSILATDDERVRCHARASNLSIAEVIRRAVHIGVQTIDRDGLTVINPQKRSSDGRVHTEGE
jgi:hypothetical protein